MLFFPAGLTVTDSEMPSQTVALTQQPCHPAVSGISAQISMCVLNKSGVGIKNDRVVFLRSFLTDFDGYVMDWL